jgi:hypothetical protein
MEVSLMGGWRTETSGETTWVDEDPPIDVQPVIIPATISMFQCKAALLQAGLLDDANAAVAGSGSPFIILAWAEGTEMQRASPSLAALAPLLGLDDAALDALFIAAAEIRA